MKLHPSFLALALLLALAACRPGAAEWNEAEAPNTLRVDNASTSFPVRFAAGSSRLIAADAARLRAAANNGSLVPSDRVTVAAGGSPALATARFNTIAAELLHHGIIASVLPAAGVAADRALIQSGRYLVTLPACPNWSKQSYLDYTNTLASNYGCATSVAFGQMIASPADLASGRPVGQPDAIPASAAVQRYMGDKVILPTAATLGPITSTNSVSPGAGSSGAGTAGSQP